MTKHLILFWLMAAAVFFAETTVTIGSIKIDKGREPQLLLGIINSPLSWNPS
jgi:hypothetical protein